MTISDPAPPAGLKIAIASASDRATPDTPTVVIAAGATTGQVLIHTASVARDTTVLLTASLGDTSKTASLTLLAPTLTGFTIAPSPVVGGTTPSLVQGTVTLSGKAPAGGVTIAVSVLAASPSDPASTKILLPTSGTVTVADGQRSALFAIGTKAVAVPLNANLRARLNNVTKDAPLSLLPPKLLSLTVVPASVPGGEVAQATLTLSVAAPDEGMLVSLSTDHADAVSLPTSVLIPAGQTQAGITVATNSVAQTVAATLTATLGTDTATGVLTVRGTMDGSGCTPAMVQSVTVSPSAIIGNAGNAGRVTGTVTLTGSAMSGGQVIRLSSDNPRVATMPSWVFVPAGQTSATFSVQTITVSQAVSLTISAGYHAGAVQTATLTVNPPSAATTGLQLTLAGQLLGFQLSTFAYGFDTENVGNGDAGPIKAFFSSNGNIIVSDIHYKSYVFSNDADGQDARTVAQFYSDNFDIVRVNSHIYADQAHGNGLAELNEDGTIQSFVPGTEQYYGFVGLAVNPITGHIYASESTRGPEVFEIDPLLGTVQVFESIYGYIDGLTVSSDGKTLYMARLGVGIFGIDTTSKQVVFQMSGFNGSDGVSVGHGAFEGKLVVNCNGGDVWLVDIASQTKVLIATGGTRGDFVSEDPTNGSLLLSQSNSLIRLIPPSNASFGDQRSQVIYSLLDQTPAYNAFPIAAPSLTGNADREATFDLSGIDPVHNRIVGAHLLRQGTLYHTGEAVDLQFGASVQGALTSQFLPYLGRCRYCGSIRGNPLQIRLVCRRLRCVRTTIQHWNPGTDAVH